MASWSGTEKHISVRSDTERHTAAWAVSRGARNHRLGHGITERHRSATGITDRHRAGWIGTGSMEQNQI